MVADDARDGETARSALRGEVDVAIPDLCDVEVANVLRKRWLRGDLDDERLDQALVDLLDLPYPRFPSAPFLARALELRANITAYDGVYIALAELLEATLLTADARLGGAPGIWCEVRVIAAEGESDG